MSAHVPQVKIENDGIQNDRESLLCQKKELEKRLIEINGPHLNHKNEWKLIKSDTHWDSLLQELVIQIHFLRIYCSLDMVSE